MTTEQLKHNAQQSASKYLRFAFDLKSTTFDECLEILTTAIYYDYEIPANMTYTKKLWLVLDTVGDSIVIDSIGITYTISGARVT